MSRDRYADVPMHDQFADVPAEHDILLAAMKEIASADPCYGINVHELAKEIVRQILEARINSKARANAMARVDLILKGAITQ